MIDLTKTKIETKIYFNLLKTSTFNVLTLA